LIKFIIDEPQFGQQFRHHEAHPDIEAEIIAAMSHEITAEIEPKKKSAKTSGRGFFLANSREPEN
jgi:hypothetical protein